MGVGFGKGEKGEGRERGEEELRGGGGEGGGVMIDGAKGRGCGYVLGIVWGGIKFAVRKR